MTEELLTLYTWQDVERLFFLTKAEWPKEWKRVDVYKEEVVIYLTEITNEVKEKTESFLSHLLKQYYDGEKINIKLTKTQMDIYLEEDESMEREDRRPFPLFKDFLYVNNQYDANISALSGVDITAFHSYKGGVGRTLSLITFVRNVLKKYGTSKRLLIIDCDIEAPGLTWLGKAQNGNYEFSYIDLLSVINAGKGMDEEIIDNISRKVQNSTLTFHTEKIEATYYFLPTYRNEEQLLDMNTNPEKIMLNEDNKYIIADVLSKLGKQLDVDLVLVDLRAGISEFSAPFLFDTRVNKIIVTSTSEQSLYGTNLLLKQMLKQKENNISNIILTMVMPEIFKGSIRDDSINLLLREDDDNNDDDDVTEDLKQMDDIIEIEKSDSVIHLGSLNQICDSLNGAGKITEPLEKVVDNLLENHDGSKIGYDRKKIEQFREELYKIAEENVTAEGSDFSNMLTTKPVMQLGMFTRELPKITILGAKGSGKTYLYKQMIFCKEWRYFLEELGKKSEIKEDVLLCPVLCTEDRTKLQNLLSQCRSNLKGKLVDVNDSPNILQQNEVKVKDAIDSITTEQGWLNFWEELFIGMFGTIHSWKELNQYLVSENKKIIFLLDGLETLFQNLMGNDNERKAIRTLCKGVINYLYEMQLENIGTIIFLRKDIAELAIEINFEQFKNQYQKYELNWEQKDAMQLAWKLSERAAQKCNIKLSENMLSINNATISVLDEELSKIWGKKMGSDNSKTASSMRWVLASLSDFTGQLQARDIVRFLKYATVEKGNASQYKDRFLAPEDMKKSIKKCSDEKRSEVEKEIPQLAECFKILQNVPTEDKKIPLNENVLSQLTLQNRKTMERYGYFREVDGECYIPESIRYALGYDKSRRGGTKLVALLVSK